MKRILLIAVISLIVGAGVSEVKADPIKYIYQTTRPFYVLDNEFGYFPNGFIFEGLQSGIYQANMTSGNELGYYTGPYATFCDSYEYWEGRVVTTDPLVRTYVPIRDTFYPVLALRAAFKNTPLKKVYLNDQIVRIEEDSFLDAKELTELTLPISLKFLGLHSLKGLEKLEKLKWRAPLPPDQEVILRYQIPYLIETGKSYEPLNIVESAFGGRHADNFVEYIPRGSMDFYVRGYKDYNYEIDEQEYDLEWEYLHNPDCEAGFKFGKSANFTTELLRYEGKNSKIEVPASLHSDDYVLGTSMQEEEWRVEGIGADAFSNNDKIKSITLPSSILYIKEGALENCENLEYFTMCPETRFVGSVFNNLPCLRVFTILPPQNGVTEELPEIFWSNHNFENIYPGAVLYYCPEDKRISPSKEPFCNFRHCEFLTSGADNVLTQTSDIIVYTAGNKIIVKNTGDNPITSTICNIDGKNFAVESPINPGEESSVGVEQGIYIVRAVDSTTKVIIK